MSLGVPPAQNAIAGIEGEPTDAHRPRDPGVDHHARPHRDPTGHLGVRRWSAQQGWFISLRLYSPLASFFDKTWRPSEIPRGGVVPAPSCPSARVSRASPAEDASDLHAVNGAASNTGYADSA